MRPPFIADVVALQRHPGHRESLVVRAPLDDLRVSESWVPAGAKVDLDVTLEAVEGGIVVQGAASAPFEGECRRCLGPVQGTVEAAVDEVFVRDPTEDGYPIEHDHIDLEPLAREAIVLGLPLAPLCRPDCAGLCPTCGADRNATECTCPPPAPDARWSALDALRELP